MGLYVTKYTLPSRFGSDVDVPTTLFARDHAHALILCRARKLGERLVNPLDAREKFNPYTLNTMRPEMPSELLRRRRYADALHACHFLSFVGVSSGVIEPTEMINDFGAAHELSHWAMFQAWSRSDIGLAPGNWWPNTDTLMERADRLETLEMLVPGFHPTAGGDDEPHGLWIESAERKQASVAGNMLALTGGFATDFPKEPRRARVRKLEEA